MALLGSYPDPRDKEEGLWLSNKAPALFAESPRFSLQSVLGNNPYLQSRSFCQSICSIDQRSDKAISYVSKATYWVAPPLLAASVQGTQEKNRTLSTIALVPEIREWHRRAPYQTLSQNLELGLLIFSSATPPKTISRP